MIYPHSRPAWLSYTARRMLAAGFVISAVTASMYGTLVWAQGIASFDRSQPVVYDAGHVELQDRQNRLELSGDVIITQGDLRFTANRMSADFTDNGGSPQIQRIIAIGSVVISRGSERAQAAAGVYDLNRRLISLSGGVALQRGSDTLNGGRLTIDLESGISSVDGRDAAGPGSSTAPSGRVTGTFQVPQQ